MGLINDLSTGIKGREAGYADRVLAQQIIAGLEHNRRLNAERESKAGFTAEKRDASRSAVDQSSLGRGSVLEYESGAMRARSGASLLAGMVARI